MISMGEGAENSIIEVGTRDEGRFVSDGRDFPKSLWMYYVPSKKGITHLCHVAIHDLPSCPRKVSLNEKTKGQADDPAAAVPATTEANMIKGALSFHHPYLPQDRKRPGQ